MDVSRKIMNEPSVCIDLSEHGTILSVQFSPYEWNQDVILIAFRNKILVAQLVFNDVLELKKLAEFLHKDVCTAMCLSPETMVNVLPLNIQFCTAGNEHYQINVYKIDDNNENICKALKGHKSYINDLSYDNNNNYIASVSDDNTARIWGIADNYECLVTFNLASPGVSTYWHRDDDSKLLVAEKNGTIRFYNINTQRPILSLDMGKSLCGAHWAPSNSQIVGSLNMGELVLWDVTKPSCPKHNLVYTSDGGCIKFSPLGELVATANKLDGFVKVMHVGSMQQRFATSVGFPTNVSWHFRLPLLCVGDDRRLCLWKILSK